jgi:hypothetical protein
MIQALKTSPSWKSLGAAGFATVGATAALVEANAERHERRHYNGAFRRHATNCVSSKVSILLTLHGLML